MQIGPKFTQVATITWEARDAPALNVETPVPVGIIEAFKKSQVAVTLNRSAIPSYVSEWLKLGKEAISKEQFTALDLRKSVSFAGWLIVICYGMNGLKKREGVEYIFQNFKTIIPSSLLFVVMSYMIS